MSVTRPHQLLEKAAHKAGYKLGIRDRAGSWFDNALGVVAPRRALKNRINRAQALMLRQAFPTGRGSRLHEDWAPGKFSGDASLEDLPDLRAKGRDLMRTDPHASSLIRVLEENVIGTGIPPQARATAEETGLSPEAVEEWNRACESLFMGWANSTDADATGHGTYWEHQRLQYRSFKGDGEAIVHPLFLNPETNPGRGPIRLALEVVAPERLSTPDGQAAIALPADLMARVRHGVEVGARDQAVAYWIASGNPDDAVRYPDIEWTRVRRFRAGRRNVLHVYRREQADMHRGVPILATSLLWFRMLSKYLEAEATAARVASCFSVFIKRSGLTDELPTGFELDESTPNQPKVLERLEPGIIEYLDPDESIESFQPNRPGTTFEPFVVRMLRAIASSAGLPYELLVRDFSRTNYSSMRAALLETRRGFRCDQALMINMSFQPTYELVIEEGYARGLLPRVPDFEGKKRALCRARWVPPAYGWVDPLKEIQASATAVREGLSTLADEAAANGQAWDDNLTARAREMRKALDLEKEFDLPKGSLLGGGAPAPAPTAPTNDQPAEPGEDDDDDATEDE